MGGNCTSILYFGTTWCPSCKTLKENLKDYDGRIPIKYIDCDEEETLTQKYNIKNIPALIYLNEDGMILERSIGAVPLQKVYDTIDKLC